MSLALLKAKDYARMVKKAQKLLDKVKTKPILYGKTICINRRKEKLKQQRRRKNRMSRHARRTQRLYA